MAGILIIGAVIVITCILCNKISNKIGIPMLLAFILLGMVFGSDGIFKIEFENFVFAEQTCSIALIFIIFYGGFGTKWKQAKQVAVQSLVLSSVGVILTALLTGLFCRYILQFEWLESLLIGSVLGSTDAASVFSILRSKKLNLKYGTASMLELESGSNDPWAYMLTITILSIMQGNSSVGSVAYMLIAQIIIGVLFGILIAFTAIFILKHVKFETVGFDAIFVLAIAVLSYAIPTALDGNGYLSAYIVGIALGNTEIYNKKSLVHFFDGITGLSQMLIFFMLGLLSFPSQMPKIIIPSVLIALFMTFIGRPIVVMGILTPFKAKLSQQIVVSWAGLRGATSIVFAIIATVNEAYISSDVFHITFCVVLLSIGIQGTLLPFVSKKFNMIDNSQNVLKTFNDYADETPIQFIKLTVDNNHKWINRQIKDITLPPHTRIIMILRSNQKVIPKGNTIIEQNDILIMSAMGYQEYNDIILKEVTIDKEHKLYNKTLSEVSLPNILVVLIMRGNKTIIPNGKVRIKENDILVVTTNKS